MSERPTFTVSSAADATGKSRRTIGRMVSTGELVGAHKNDEGAWVIPLEALLGAGLRVNAPSPPDATPIALAAITAPIVPSELERVRSEAIEWRRRAEVAEAIATERAAALEDVRAALAIAQRMLPPIATIAVEPPSSARRSPWWRRAK